MMGGGWRGEGRNMLAQRRGGNLGVRGQDTQGEVELLDRRRRGDGATSRMSGDWGAGALRSWDAGGEAGQILEA